jgi:hypothetical protein
VTLAPAVANTENRPNVPMSDAPYTETVSSASSVIMFLSSLGDWDFGDMEDPTTSTKNPNPTIKYSYPTGTSVNDLEKAGCYSDYDEMENAAKFSINEAYDGLQVLRGTILSESRG